MEQQETIEKIEEFSDKYLWKMPDFTVVEYAVIAVTCFYIARRLFW